MTKPESKLNVYDMLKNLRDIESKLAEIQKWARKLQEKEDGESGPERS